MELTVRSMTFAERNYCYSQSDAVSKRAGLIGHLRGYWGDHGPAFFSDFFDYEPNYKTDDFAKALDDVINALRFDKQYGYMLKDRKSIADYCRNQRPLDGENRHFGFRADISVYSFMIRLNPNKGEYNLYCYCYQRKFLDRHLSQAAKGIRFITPQYKDLFRIDDGDKIRIITKAGEKRDMVCRYLDDHHFEAQSYRGNAVYHICEFAEQFEKNGCQALIPLRESLPEQSVAPNNCEVNGKIIPSKQNHRLCREGR